MIVGPRWHRARLATLPASLPAARWRSAPGAGSPLSYWGRAGGHSPVSISISSQPSCERSYRRSHLDDGGGIDTGFVLDRVLLTSDGRYAFETTVILERFDAPTPRILEVTRTNFARFPIVEVGWEDADVMQSFLPDQVDARPEAARRITVRIQFRTPITGHPPGADPSEWSANPVVVTLLPRDRADWIVPGVRSGDLSDVRSKSFHRCRSRKRGSRLLAVGSMFRRVLAIWPTSLVRVSS